MRMIKTGGVFLLIAALLIIGIPVAFADSTPTVQTLKPTRMYLNYGGRYNGITNRWETEDVRARLNGSVNPGGGSCTVYFEYGTTTAYGSTASAGTVSGASAVSVSAALTGLRAATLYHCRLVAASDSGIVYGHDLAFIPSCDSYEINYLPSYHDVLKRWNAQFIPSSDPAGNIEIVAPPAGIQIVSFFDIENHNPFDVTLGYSDGETRGTLVIGSLQTQEINVPKGSICSFYYNNTLFKQVLTNDQDFAYNETPLPRNKIEMYFLGSLANRQAGMYSINNRNAQEVTLELQTGSNIYTVSVPASSNVYFLSPTGYEVQASMHDDPYNPFMVVSPAVMKWYGAALVTAEPKGTSDTTATFELQNNDDAAHAVKLKNAGGVTHAYTLAPYEHQTVTIEKSDWDVYLQLSNLPQPNIAGWVEDGYVKINSASPGAAVLPPLNVSGATDFMGAYGGSVTPVYVTGGGAWTAVSDQPWLTVSPAAGSGFSWLTMTASANTSSSFRSANVTVSDGTTTKTVTVTQTGQGRGNALSFDGVDDYVSIPDNDDGITNAFTIETWVKWEPNSSSDIQFICGKNTEQMEIQTGGSANSLRFIPTPGVYLDAAGVLPTGVWTHVAVVYQPSAALAKMYINGNEVALTNNGAQPVTSPLASSSSSFVLGSRGNGNYPFKGSLDDFRIWNRALTQNEIRQNMLNPIDPSDQTGLVSAYSFNQGVAGGDNAGVTTLADETGYRNGSLSGFALSGPTSNWVVSGAGEGLVSYTVTYDGNGADSGTVPSDPLRYVVGAQATVKAAGSLVKTGSTFAGWNTAAGGSGTSYAAGETLTMGAANVTLYAQWTANPPLTHTVSVSSNPPAGGTVSGGGTYAEGASVTVMATPNSGYTFVNWTEGGSQVSTNAAFVFTLGTADRTLVANFTAIPPVITTGTISGTVTDGTNPLAGATVSLTVSGSVYSAATAGNGSYSILNVPAGTGYTVTAGLTGYTGANKTNVNVTANTTTSGVNLTLSAIPPATYTVSIGSLTGGSITASPSTATSGAAINLTITPDAGMQLKAGTLKYNDGTTDHLISGTSFTMPAANVMVSAEFETIPPAPTLTVLTLSGSIPDLTVGQAVYDLNNLSLNGTDQYGAPFSLSGQTVQWNLASGNAYAGLTGSLLTPLAAGSGTVTATVYGVASNPLGFTVLAPRSSGGGGNSGDGGGGGSHSSSSTSTTVTGNVIDGTTGVNVSSVTATVTTNSTGSDTVSMSAAHLAVLKQPDGTVSPLSDLSHVAITGAAGTPAPISADGTIQVANLTKGTDNNFNITYDLGHGQKITIATLEIKIDSSGNVSLTITLIDPYGIITDAATGKALAGVKVTLYYAGTERNKAAGKTPDTVVALPSIAGFKPSNNQDPQTSDSSGAYGFMVFPTTDYYIVATKDGYDPYTSPTISVEQEIVHWDFKMSPTTSGVIRLAGRSRVDTALAIAQAEYTGKISNVILATADNYPDALAGSVLAYKLNAPILLVGSSEADQAKVLNYLKSNLDPAGTVYILGGTAAVSSAMENKVAASGFNHITRIGGADRYETSVKIADQLAVKTGTPVVLVTGENYPDGLSVSSVAAQMQLPILLVQKDGISSAVAQEIAAIKPAKVYIIGGEAAIGTAVANQAAQITGLAQTNIVRIGGADRYATSLDVARYFNLAGQDVCVATGDNFPDALAGSVYAAAHNAPIVLADGSLPDQVMNYLKSKNLTGATIFGGEAVVSKGIEQQLRQLVGSKG